MSDSAPTKISLVMQLGSQQDVHCRKCGKDIYRSSTGCLCVGGPDIAPGPGSFGAPRTSAVPLVCPKCGGARERAMTMDERVLACKACGDQQRSVASLAETQQGDSEAAVTKKD